MPEYAVNDFGTNNTIGGLLAAAAMVIGALVWCTGHRWGAGIAGGAGAALAGWAALVLGAAEWRLDLAAPEADASRALGYWILGAAGAVGIVALLASLAASGRDRRNGLDPWIAALAAVSFLIAAGGPLIPENGAGWASNWTGENPGGLPTMFFVGRAVQLGLLVVCGVLGCLLVRRWGLGLAIGGALTAGWLLVTAATDRTTSPIGPGLLEPVVPGQRAARGHDRRVRAGRVLLSRGRRDGPARRRTLTPARPGRLSGGGRQIRRQAAWD